jgi:hypothetical protein
MRAALEIALRPEHADSSPDGSARQYAESVGSYIAGGD